jgi:hypothetical protein
MDAPECSLLDPFVSLELEIKPPVDDLFTDALVVGTGGVVVVYSLVLGQEVDE